MFRYKLSGDQKTIMQGFSSKTVTPTSFTSVTPTGSASSTVCWTGTHNVTAGGLLIYQCVSLSGTSFGVTIKTTLTNQYNVPITDVLYSRSVNPDNDKYWSSSSYDSNNTVYSVQTNGIGTAVVGAAGKIRKDWWIGIRTSAPNSRCGVQTGSVNSYDAVTIEGAMSGASPIIKTALNSNAVGSNYAITCLINVATSLAPGESTTFEHAYILDQTEGLAAASPPPSSPPPPPSPSPPPSSSLLPMASAINGVAYGSGYLKASGRGGPFSCLLFLWVPG